MEKEAEDLRLVEDRVEHLLFSDVLAPASRVGVE
jgi:hypothetical protein